jgi:hypothetical protein
MQAAETKPRTIDPEERADLEELIRLVEKSRVPQARELVVRLVEKWPDSPSVRHWARVLEPPCVLPRWGAARSLERERAWLREHAQEYPGCWLAVYEDRLIAASPDRRSVVQAARAELGSEGVLLFFQPGSRE